MAYITGTAATLDDIIAAIQSACTSNGWTLTNDILSKGTCFVRIWKPSATRIQVSAGRGQTGGAGSTLTGITNAGPRGVGNKFFNQPFSFPMTYFIHVFANPDEVYVFLNYNSTYYARLMFGQSNVAGLVGTGNYYDASFNPSNPDDTQTGYPDLRISSGVGSTAFCPYPFSNESGYLGGDSGLDHSLTANPAWSGVHFTWFNYPLLVASPNAWNGESVLLPARGYVSMSGYNALVAELQNMRFLSMDNLDPQQILTIGTDKWKIYPCWRKGTRANFNSSGNTNPANPTDSSVYAVAIRYDGP